VTIHRLSEVIGEMDLTMSRPRVAVITTTYFPGSHADCFITPLIEGYEFDGHQTEPRVEVVAMYLEQLHENDMGVELTDRYGIPRFGTVGEALAVGGPGVQVDGVVIIAEHGEYENNEYGQKLYPRRRLVDAAMASMVGAGRFVPLVNDKHLAWNVTDARAIYDNARRLGIPLLAGSTIPLSWRVPTGEDWPLDEPMDDILVVGFGPTEIYGHHNLEALQVFAERRAGGETGVVSVQALSGDAAKLAVDDETLNPELLDRALAAISPDASIREDAKRSIREVFLVEYADGLKATVVNCGESLNSWGIAASGPTHAMDCMIWLQPFPYSHSLFLVRQIESLIVNRAEPYPAERTLLTTGMLDALMRSLHENGAGRATPELDISYVTADVVPDTGVHLPLPTTHVTGS
jgi:hypothetical protein